MKEAVTTKELCGACGKATAHFMATKLKKKKGPEFHSPFYTTPMTQTPPTTQTPLLTVLPTGLPERPSL